LWHGLALADIYYNNLGYEFIFMFVSSGIAFGVRHISETVGQKSYDIKSKLLYNEVIEGIHEFFWFFYDHFTQRTKY